MVSGPTSGPAGDGRRAGVRGRRRRIRDRVRRADRQGAVASFKPVGTIIAPPMTYSLNGRQYVAVAAGQTMITFALPK